jgi:hypothetical protein
MLSAGSGLTMLASYANQPGQPASPPARWPESSRLERTPGQATLVMLLHPGCPCSRASVEELDRLMARCHGLVAVHLLFFKPRDFAEGWEKTDLWQRAAAIPGVHLWPDDDGVEAARFGAATSGQAIVYDANDALRFSGGITPSRGHSGDNPGRDAVVALLTASPGRSPDHTPVFGCSLRDPGAAPRYAGTNDAS